MNRPTSVLTSLLFASVSLAPGGLAQETELEASRTLWRARYAKVEAELRARDVSALSESQRQARARVLEELHAYWDEADFGVDTAHESWRAPLFVDADGRRCAVAQLLHEDGRDELVARVAADANEAFLAELTGEAELLAWLDGVGLSVSEAARIQGPALPSNRTGRTENIPPIPAPRGAPANSGPVDTTGSSVAAGGSPTAARPGTSPAALAGGLATQPSARATAHTIAPAADGWWVWWEMNKLAYLQPNRLDGAPRRGMDLSTTAAPSVIVQLRGELLSRLMVRLRDPEATVRAAACISLARLAGGDVVPLLDELLTDSSQLVRERAILALGATGSPQAQSRLIAIARTGRADDKRGGDALTPTAKTTALVALGLGRTYGMDESLDDFVDELLEKRRRADRRLVGLGGLMYQRLVRAESLWPRVREMATSSKENYVVRCRAIETLADDEGQVALLTRLTAERHLEVRRSALLALGDHASPLALPALMTAYDLEREPTTRGFAALSIGRHGGEGARDFLIRELREGPRSARPWNVLALGVLNDQARDDTATAAILDAMTRERNVDARGAYLLAAGLSRDVRALDAAREALFSSDNERTRMYAATALGLIGGPTARMLLNERERSERSDLARSGLLQALGAIGHADDADTLVEGLTRMSTPEYRVVVAVALGFHGSHAAVEGLMEVSAGEELYGTALAAAIDGLGLLLGRREGMLLAGLSRQSNFGLYEPWMVDLLRTTL